MSRLSISLKIIAYLLVSHTFFVNNYCICQYNKVEMAEWESTHTHVNSHWGAMVTFLVLQVFQVGTGEQGWGRNQEPDKEVGILQVSHKLNDSSLRIRWNQMVHVCVCVWSVLISRAGVISWLMTAGDDCQMHAGGGPGGILEEVVLKVTGDWRFYFQWSQTFKHLKKG